MKRLVAPEAKNVIDMRELEQIHDDELRHFELVRSTIGTLGGDPTTQTPCADLVGVQSMGLVQAMNDPRTTMAQCVHTVLIAELADNAGWELLIGLAREMGHTDLVRQFQQAARTEERHLANVKGWLEQLTLSEAKLAAAK